MKHSLTFDPKFPGNERWKEALSKMHYYDLKGKKYKDQEGTELYRITGEEPQELFAIFRLTATDTIRYQIWKSRSSVTEQEEARLFALDRIDTWILIYQADIIDYIEEIQPLVDYDDFYSQAEAVLLDLGNDLSALCRAQIGA